MKNLSLLISSISLGLILSMIITDKKEPIEIKIVVVSDESKSIKDSSDIHIDSVRNFLKESKIKFADLVLAQCILESEHFTSDLKENNNNILGMKHPGQRPTTSRGSKNGYADFPSWRHCLIDYAIWQTKYAKNCKTDQDYLDLLSRVYASDRNYTSKLIKLVNGFRKEK